MAEEEKKDIINLEECAKQGKKPGLGHAYIIKVDGKSYQVEQPTLTGRDILTLVRRPVNEYYLQEKLSDGNS